MSKTKKRPVIESDNDDSDASNLEQELLSLVSVAKRPKLAPTVPAAQSSGSDSSSESDDEWTVDGKRSGAKKVKIKKSRGSRPALQQKRLVAGGGQRRPAPETSSDSSEDENEGEAQAGSQASSSSSSSSSDSDSSSSESLRFDDGLDDELVGDEEDRKKLSLMTDVEREKEMYNRYEKRQALKARFEIEQKLRRERKAEKKRLREKEERQKRMLLREKRPRTKEEKSKSRAMDELKARRDKQKKAEAEKQAQQALQQQQQQREPLKAWEVFSSGSEEESSSSSSSASGQEDSDDESGGKTLSGLRASAPKYISTLEELNKIKLSRFRLEKWVHMPFFAETVRGCFIRVGIGAHEGRMVYRICEIIGVQETPKVYTLGSTRTNKGLRLRHGLQERMFRMEYVSNSAFTDTEFQKWKAELERKGLNLPTSEAVSKKSKKLEASKNFEFKDEDIEHIILEKQKFRKNPRNYAMTKNRLIREKELAEIEGDRDRMSTLAQQLEELEERADQLDKQRTKGLSAISYINERNRQGNVTRAEQALKEEMATGGKNKEDPFTRRKCHPTLVNLAREVSLPGAAELLHKLSQAETEEDKEAVRKAMKEQAPELLSPTTPNGQSSSSFNLSQETPDVSQLFDTPVLPKQEHKSDVDDLFSAHDFDIHIDLPSGPEGPSTVKAMPKSTPPKNEGPRRSLNLADYKKRRGLI